MFELSVNRRFTSTHALFTASGPVEEPHIHDFRLEVRLACETLDGAGMAVDFREIDRAMDGIVGRMEGADLGTAPLLSGLSPSAENIARGVYSNLKEELAGKARVSRVTVWEDPEHSASFFEGP
ncbi:MAG: 6-carboxytetrahydropterin synthase [Proteobacteria bacterium]|nr:6-carboxytetrahydropterin synthase [Pseudomonadota bacterium]